MQTIVETESSDYGIPSTINRFEVLDTMNTIVEPLRALSPLDTIVLQVPEAEIVLESKFPYIWFHKLC